MPTFEPVTLTFSGGERIELSRLGDIVTAVVYPRQDAVRMVPGSLVLPEDFALAAGDALFIVNPDGDAPAWQLQVNSTDVSRTIVPFGAFGTIGPYTPNPATIQWLADPLLGANWPITATDLRKALQIGVDEEDTDELTLFATVACERIDQYTGRDIEPARHELAPGKLPTIFILAARETAKLWWQQTKNGPRNRPPQGEAEGPPAGIDLPRKVQGWLDGYTPRLYREPTT